MKPLLAALAVCTAAASADAGHFLRHHRGFYGGVSHGSALGYRLDYSPYRYAGLSSYHGPALYQTGYARRPYYDRPYAYGGAAHYASPYAAAYRGSGYGGYGFRSSAYPGTFYNYNRHSPFYGTGLGYGSSALGFGYGYGGLGYGFRGYGTPFAPVTVGYPYEAGYLNPHSPGSFQTLPVYVPQVTAYSPCVYGSYGYGH